MRPDRGDRGKKLLSRLEAIAANPFEQALALRRQYLPGEGDDTETLARALWLDRHHHDNQVIAVANGIAKAFND
ncbi:DUF6890 family protein [Aeromonas hydrophila]|uniref:DUF6890 family protein n=1 Tax=Aeromonas hydrophila TaxID=644 RepID=UPI003F73233A